MENRRAARIIYSAVIAFINALCTSGAISHACFGWNVIEHYKWAMYFAVSFIIAYMVFYLSEHINFAPVRTANVTYKFSYKRMFAVACILFVCWLPYLIIYAPGLVNYDTVNQVKDFLDGVSAVPYGYAPGQEEVTVLFNAHHPVFVTLIFGAFIKIGILLGKPALGLTLYIILQMVLAALIFSYAIEKAFEFGKNKSVILRRMITIFFALFPVIPYYVCDMLKNTLHALFALLYIFLFLRFVISGHEFTRNEKIAWVVLSILVTLTQNTGVYLVIITGVFLAIKGKNIRKTVIFGTAVSALLMLVILPKIIYPAFNIFPGGKQEVLGILFQQTARYVRDYPEDITDEDIEVISKVVDYDTLKNDFTFETTDNIKATFKLHASTAELHNYYALWIRQGIKHPGAYFRAILPICGMFFAAGYDIGIFDHIPTNEGIFSQIQQINPENMYTSMTNGYYRIRSFPVLRILFQHALYVLWIPVFCLYRRRVVSKKKSVLFMVPFVVNMLFLIMSPMVYSRYALPLIFASPFLLYMTLLEDGINSGKECEIV
ncbi:DUF6020 family protein [Butyrivibrio sp. VCD2006]|uniref:DUF6020 family protein n=1 Tax=Butyrivibrio sp. VCD2006 TaxID=1280664 RepID=UPI001A9A60FC|nr:DUF6020 family protein [Butyrivibrio sp. VCD2006]